MSIVFSLKPFVRLVSPNAYDAGRLDQQFINVQQSLPPSNVVRTSAAYTIQGPDRWISGDTTAGNFAVKLPQDPSQVAAMEVTVTNVGSGTLTVTGTVSGATNPTLSQWQSITIVSDGVRYVKTASV